MDAQQLDKLSVKEELAYSTARIMGLRLTQQDGKYQLSKRNSSRPFMVDDIEQVCQVLGAMFWYSDNG